MHAVDVTHHLWALVDAVLAHGYDDVRETPEFDWFAALTESGRAVEVRTASLAGAADGDVLRYPDVDALFEGLHAVFDAAEPSRERERFLRCYRRMNNAIDANDLCDELGGARLG